MKDINGRLIKLNDDVNIYINGKLTYMGYVLTVFDDNDVECQLSYGGSKTFQKNQIEVIP